MEPLFLSMYILKLPHGQWLNLLQTSDHITHIKLMGINTNRMLIVDYSGA